MMPENLGPPASEHRRKRVRKGTRSCWECKRRKVKCVYQSEDHSICTGCLERGTHCLSQEYIDDAAPRENNQALRQRMVRVEQILEQLVERVAKTAESEPPLPGSNLPTPSTTPSMSERVPYMTLFDDTLARQTQTEDIEGFAGSTSTDLNGRLLNGCSPSAAYPSTLQVTPRLERLRRHLARMMPCQHDVDLLTQESAGWWLIERHVLPHFFQTGEDTPSDFLNVLTVSKQHPVVIARLLLCVALCIQQVSIASIAPRLRTKVPLLEMSESIIHTVGAEITSDDELIGSLEGIECLTLQGIYQLNAGNLRRSWLQFRRGINIAQLMGLHRVSLKSFRENSEAREMRRQHTWFEIVKGDRYLSLILGVPAATTTLTTRSVIPTSIPDPWLTTEGIYLAHLCDIASAILIRNEGDSSHAFATTQEIDERLDTLAKTMPSAWWALPSDDEIARVLSARTEEAAVMLDRLNCQVWHCELESLVHLPFMLRAATDRRYEYSRVSCLAAARGLIERWGAMRRTPGQSSICNVVEFQAFTAAVTLILGLLCRVPPIGESGGAEGEWEAAQRTERAKDMAIVESVATTLDGLRPIMGAHVINQSVGKIRELQKTVVGDGGAKEASTEQGGTLKLTIPHFGTIVITKGGGVQTLDGERILGARPWGEDRDPEGGDEEDCERKWRRRLQKQSSPRGQRQDFNDPTAWNPTARPAAPESMTDFCAKELPIETHAEESIATRGANSETRTNASSARSQNTNYGNAWVPLTMQTPTPSILEFPSSQFAPVFTENEQPNIQMNPSGDGSMNIMGPAGGGGGGALIENGNGNGNGMGEDNNWQWEWEGGTGLFGIGAGNDWPFQESDIMLFDSLGGVDRRFGGVNGGGGWEIGG